MIWTLRIKLQYYEDAWSADMEIDSTSTLEDLHYAIQEAVDFDNDHLYAFCVARTYRSRDREFFHDDDERVFTTVEAMFPLPPRKSLFYVFDFGDEWLFKVTRTRKRPHEPREGVVYPRVAKEVGEKPEQYPDPEEDY